MDPIDESIVELADPVSGQEKNSAVVFDDTKEHCAYVSFQKTSTNLDELKRVWLGCTDVCKS